MTKKRRNMAMHGVDVVQLVKKLTCCVINDNRIGSMTYCAIPPCPSQM